MEDVSKALLIGAGMFFAILLVSALVMFYNQGSSFYNSKHDANVIEQAQKFNASFLNYNRKNLRGSDLISLMNKIIDYNEAQAYDVENKYKRISVTITMGDLNIIKRDFIFDQNISNRNIYLGNEIKNTDGENWVNDNKLISITKTSSDLITELESIGVTNPTDGKLQLLSSKSHTIILSDEDEKDKENQRKRVEAINDILGTNIVTSDKTKIDKIENITNRYYQYTMFKRAKFDCTEVLYDEETNRIKAMNFKLQIKNGSAVFD